jgi:hypothetical protein
MLIGREIQIVVVPLLVIVCDSLISWRNKKQTLPSRSSTKSKYRALADTTAEVLWLRWLLADMGAPQPSSPIDLHCDNQSAIQIAHNDVFHESTKHIEVDCHFTRKNLLCGTIGLLPIGTLDKPTDLFTKSYSRKHFTALVSKLKLVSSAPTGV